MNHAAQAVLSESNSPPSGAHEPRLLKKLANDLSCRGGTETGWFLANAPPETDKSPAPAAGTAAVAAADAAPTAEVAGTSAAESVAAAVAAAVAHSAPTAADVPRSLVSLGCARGVC